MNKVKYTQWIDSYVDGELDEAGRKNFEAELTSNRELALEFQLENDLGLDALGNPVQPDQGGPSDGLCDVLIDLHNVLSKTIARALKRHHAQQGLRSSSEIPLPHMLQPRAPSPRFLCLSTIFSSVMDSSDCDM